MRVGARFFRLKYGQLKCDRRALNTRSFQKRKYAASRLAFAVHKSCFSLRYILRVSCKNRLTKPRVCGIIFSASERISTRSNQIFRGIAQLVEQRSPKPRAEGSSPSAPAIYADIAQSVERILGKDEVTGSNPVISSIKTVQLLLNGFFVFVEQILLILSISFDNVTNNDLRNV